jgi:peroxiredoxin
MPAEIGKPAPDCNLPDQSNNRGSLAHLKGSKAIIVFIPFPFTGVCEGELCAIRDDYSNLTGLGAKVVAITTTPRPSVKAWSDQNNFQFPVLSDFWPHGAVAKEYGSFNEENGAARRYSYILDAEGVVRAMVRSEQLPQGREHSEYAKALAEI